MAHTLNRLNANRQEIERNMFADIQAIIARQPELLERRTLVLAHPDWHEGVIGIVASKLMDMYYRPVVLIALKDGHGRGSARSIPGIDLFACLTACRPHLEELGGHTQAAGLQIGRKPPAGISPGLRGDRPRRLGPEPFIPSLQVDSELGLGDDLRGPRRSDGDADARLEQATRSRCSWRATSRWSPPPGSVNTIVG